MNFGEKEPFHIKHRYFFQKYSFKFEGLTPQGQKELENIVKSLSGKIGGDSSYILTDIKYFKLNATRTDLYSVVYLLDCIEQYKHLDITQYKFLKDGLQKNQAIEKKISQPKSITNISKPKSIHKWLKKNEVNDLNTVDEVNEVNGVNGTDTESDSSDIPFTKKINHNVIVHYKNQQANNHQVIDLVSSSNDEEDIQKSTPERNFIKKRRIIDSKKNSTCSSSLNPIDVDSESENINTNASMLKNRRKFKRKNPISDNESLPDRSVHNPKRRDLVKRSQAHSDWDSLPRPGHEPNENYKEPPTVERGGNRPIFTKSEQVLMLKYVYLKGYVCDALKAIVWRNFHKDGYLRHRTVESLRNNFRRSILPNLKLFVLPDYFKKSLILNYGSYVVKSRETT